jgi:hypothetical protein
MKVGVKDGHLRRQRDKMICENQPAKERQKGGEAPADKRRRRVMRWRRPVLRRRRRDERTRGSGGATIGVTQQPAGKQEAIGRGGICRQEVVDCQEDKKWQQRNKRRHDNRPEATANKRQRHLESRWHLETRRGGGCMARGQEIGAAHCKFDRGRWMQHDKRQCNNQPGQTREVNGRWTPRLAVGRQEEEKEAYFYQAVECVFDQICSFGLYVIRYVMFLCFQVQFRTKQMKCFLAYVMLNIIYVFMLSCFWEG